MENTVSEYGALLRATVLLAGLSEQETLCALQRMDAVRRDYSRGAFLLHAGEKVGRFGLLLSGRLNACMDDLEGDRMIMANVTEGMTFAESLCFLRVEESPVYIVSTEDSRVLWLSPHRLFETEGDPLSAQLRNRFTAMLAERTLSMNNRIQILSKLTLREKLRTYFSSFIRDNGDGSFLVPMNREELAVYIGANRSALSRELSKMRKEGALDFKGSRFTIRHTD